MESFVFWTGGRWVHVVIEHEWAPHVTRTVTPARDGDGSLLTSAQPFPDAAPAARP